MADTLEDGDIYFLYRPRVGEERVASVDEVQRLLIVLHPWRGRPRREAPELPRDLLDRFDTHRFIPLDPPDFLDHPGTELVLIGAAEDASEELGIDLDAEVERAARRSMFDDLRLSQREHPVEPLFAGQWR